MRTARPGWPPAAGAEPEVLIKEARRRQRRRYLVAGLATAVVLAGAAGITVGLAGPAAHSPARQGPRRVAHRGAGRSPVPARAMRLTGEVAYKCGDSICLMRPDGTGLHALPGIFAQWDATWSPDGHRLAFRGYYGLGDGQYDLYAAGANGCHLTRLTHLVNGISPAWSPTGDQIAFAGLLGIDLINADGTGLRPLISGTSRYGYDEPAWSVRNRIAFRQTRTGASEGQIHAVNPDGSGVAPLTHGAPGFAQPSWSPDGTAIAFVAVTVPLQSAGVIEVANADGTGRHRVSPPSWTSYSPTWTPGGRVVFLVRRNTTTSAYIVNRDGSGMRLLYPNLGDALQIAWGPTPLPPARC
jgi:dipeptidyl aminopeptidase/acylaminoacyl peptidase